MRFKSPAVFAIRIIENKVKVAMLLVDMASHKILILAFKELLTYLLTELQGSFGSNFPRLETHNEVLGKNGAFSCTMFPNLSKVTTCL